MQKNLSWIIILLSLGAAFFSNAEPLNVGLYQYLPDTDKDKFKAMRLRIQEELKDNAPTINVQVIEASPYQMCIDTCTTPEFINAYEEYLSVFERYLEQASLPMQQKMLDAFIHACWYEWHFWNDAYHLKTLNLNQK